MHTTQGDNVTFIVNPPEVHSVGLKIEGDAQALISPGPYSLLDFQTTFTAIKQKNFPTALQGVLETFIKNQHDGYLDILQNREAIGLVLQDKVATDTEVTDVMTKNQFEAQLKEIQNESH